MGKHLDVTHSERANDDRFLPINVNLVLTCLGLMTFITCCFLHASTATAQSSDFPARYDVAGDALSILVSPEPNAAVSGDLKPDRTGLEVLGVSENGIWAQIGRGETTGWVRADGLIRQDPPRDQAIPMRCHGLEPFWGVNLPAAYFAEFERPEHPEIPFQIKGISDKVGPGGRARLWALVGDTASASLLVRHELCHDGMSDRTFGLSAAFSLIENTGAVHLHLGCCTLTPP